MLSPTVPEILQDNSKQGPSWGKKLSGYPRKQHLGRMTRWGQCSQDLWQWGHYPQSCRESSGLVPCLFLLRSSPCHPSARRMTGKCLPKNHQPGFREFIQQSRCSFVPVVCGNKTLFSICSVPSSVLWRECSKEETASPATVLKEPTASEATV